MKWITLNDGSLVNLEKISYICVAMGSTIEYYDGMDAPVVERFKDDAEAAARLVRLREHLKVVEPWKEIVRHTVKPLTEEEKAKADAQCKEFMELIEKREKEKKKPVEVHKGKYYNFLDDFMKFDENRKKEMKEKKSKEANEQ